MVMIPKCDGLTKTVVYNPVPPTNWKHASHVVYFRKFEVVVCITYAWMLLGVDVFRS